MNYLRLLLLLFAIAINTSAHSQENNESPARVTNSIESIRNLDSESNKGRMHLDAFGPTFDFIQIAISESNWQALHFDDPSSTNYTAISNSFREAIYDNLPRFFEYFVREKGMPPSSVINKWNNDYTIKLGLGWPKFIQPYPIATLTSKLKEYNSIKSNIENNIFLIKEASGLDIEFLEEENENNYGRFRIIFVAPSHFKDDSLKLSRKFKEFSQKPYFHSYFERYFLGAVPFSPYSNDSIDGYFLPSHKNEIEWAVCYIKTGLTDHELFYQLQECMLRGLGLPDETRESNNSILSNSNIEHGLRIKELQPFDATLLQSLYQSNVSSGDNYWHVFENIGNLLHKKGEQHEQ